jgi:hypothetical protein
MRTITNITYSTFALFGFVCFAFAPHTRAQCPQICDFNSQNTALGIDALPGNTGSDNTATGFNALRSNTSGFGNTANGQNALFSNTTGVFNTANSETALYLNRTGNDNTAEGAGALFSNTIGNGSTATGFNALLRNTTASYNTATGFQALLSNTTGTDNTAIGVNALWANTTGFGNIALGFLAGANLTTGSNNIDIGNKGEASESNTIRIGKAGTQTSTFIAGITGTTVANGVGVIIGSNGKLGTVVSSERFKEAIKPMDKASEAILALKPVSFRYKKDLDADRIPQFGLVAEDVEKVAPDLVARDEQGKLFSVRYDAVNAMLLNEFLKEHRKVQELEANAARQQKQIEALTAGLQKVSAQLELSKTAPQTVLNDQ